MTARPLSEAEIAAVRIDIEHQSNHPRGGTGSCLVASTDGYPSGIVTASQWLATLDAARARVAELQAALEKYGDHINTNDWMCSVWVKTQTGEHEDDWYEGDPPRMIPEYTYLQTGVCNCGLAAALAARGDEHKEATK